MAISKVGIDEFLRVSGEVPVADVRSPAEYLHAHMPGAASLPLFSDEERKLIGTAYKQESRENAIKIGFEAFGKKMVDLVDAAEVIVKNRRQPTREIAVHCWRGGMRSAAVAWLLDLYGFKVYLLAGGYKSYRRRMLEVLNEPWPLAILGGCTGGNKTGVITEMQNNGIKAIDLEALAAHKGSAFGNLDLVPQPGQEHFENLLAMDLLKLSAKVGPVWLEAESQRLGQVNIPFDFFCRMRVSPMYFLDIPFDERLKHILAGYGKYNKEKLINAIIRIKKKLGGLEAKNAVNALMEEDVSASFSILLKYYDRLYIKSTKEPENENRSVINIESNTTDPATNLEKILQHARN